MRPNTVTNRKKGLWALPRDPWKAPRAQMTHFRIPARLQLEVILRPKIGEKSIKNRHAKKMDYGSPKKQKTPISRLPECSQTLRIVYPNHFLHFSTLFEKIRFLVSKRSQIEVKLGSKINAKSNKNMSRTKKCAPGETPGLRQASARPRQSPRIEILAAGEGLGRSLQ